MYVEQHPTVSFAELEKVFNPALQGSYGVIRTINYIREKGYKRKRYMLEENELLHNSDGITFAVCSQWRVKNISKMVDLAKKLGYVVTISGDSAPSPAESEKEGVIACVLTRNADAKGIFDIATQTMIVLKGSKINPHHLDNIRLNIKQKREALIAEFAERSGDELVLVKDATFYSPSAAAMFCVGGSSNGWREWRDENNNGLDIYRK